MKSIWNWLLVVLLIPLSVCMTGFIAAVFAYIVQFREKINIEGGHNLLSFLTGSDLFLVLGTIFGGIVAAFAIYVAFKQANQLHLNAAKQAAKEHYYERKMSDLSKISDITSEFLTTAISLNMLEDLTVALESHDQIMQRYHAVQEICRLVEQNYTALFLTGVLYDHCYHCPMQCKLTTAEEKLTKSQAEFAAQYRQTYHRIHGWLNDYLTATTQLHLTPEGWIWEVKEKFEQALKQTEPVQFRDNMQVYTDILNEKSQAIIPAAKEFHNHLSEITSMVVTTRDSFAIFLQDYKRLEQEILETKDGKSAAKSCKANRLAMYKENCKIDAL